MPMPIVRLVLICEAIEFAHKATEFAQHVYKISSRSPLLCKSNQARQWASADGIPLGMGFISQLMVYGENGARGAAVQPPVPLEERKLEPDHVTVQNLNTEEIFVREKIQKQKTVLNYHVQVG